jgi:hypothetical protein
VNKSATLILISLSIALIAGFSTLLWMDHRMGKRFENAFPDQGLAEFLSIAGEPQDRMDCEKAERPITRENAEAIARANGGMPRYCKLMLIYRTFLPGDGWVVAVDEQGVVMQITRKGLP